LGVDTDFDERCEVVVDFLVEVEDESFVLVLLVILRLLDGEETGFEVELVFLSDEVVLVGFGVDEEAGFEVELVFLSDEVVLVGFRVDDDAFLVDELDSLDDEVEVANPKVYTST
jgi:uncharacterized protein YihD (DUF1040 family)